MALRARQRRCNESCIDAKSDFCTCSCGGENHGLGAFGAGLADREFEASISGPMGEVPLDPATGWPNGHNPSAWVAKSPADMLHGPAPVAPDAVYDPTNDVWNVIRFVCLCLFLLRFTGIIH